MDVSEYRRQYEQQLREAGQQSGRRRTSRAAAAGVAGALASDEAQLDEQEDAVAVVGDKKEDAARRAAALSSMASEIDQGQESIEMVIGLLGDPDEPPEIRLAALRHLQVISFSSSAFSSMRPEFLSALRTAVDSTDDELRQEALAILAQSQDEYAQRRLLEGLQNPAEALVPPETAIRLLAYDIHTSYFPVLQDIVRKPPSAAAKRAAIRVLAADPSSREMLSEILNDKRQSRPTRQASAIALQSLAPTEFAQHARRIVMDPEENADLRATVITGLTNLRGEEARPQDDEISTHIERLVDNAPSPAVQRSASRFMAKLNDER